MNDEQRRKYLEGGLAGIAFEDSGYNRWCEAYDSYYKTTRATDLLRNARKVSTDRGWLDFSNFVDAEKQQWDDHYQT